MWKKVLALLVGLLFGYWLIDDFNPDVLKGKNVIITGASAGIGEQMVYHFARMGANVLVTARRENVLKQVVSKCKEEGRPDGRYHYFPADMSNLSSTTDVIREAKSKLGGIDYLVLNHILPIPLGLWEGTADNLTLANTVIDVNFKAYVHLTSHALPHLKQSSGHIVVVSSLSGKVGQPFTAIYSATKFALAGFFGGLRQEFLMSNCDISITLCTMGLIGTDNAVQQLKSYRQDHLLKTVPAESPSDAALAIIKGGATRKREIFFPYYGIRLATLFRDWFPDAIDYINRMVYSYNS